MMLSLVMLMVITVHKKKIEKALYFKDFIQKKEKKEDNVPKDWGKNITIKLFIV